MKRMARVIRWLFENNKRRLGVLMGIMLGVLGFETVVNLLSGDFHMTYRFVVIQAASMAKAMLVILLFLSPSFIMRKLNRTDRAVEFFSLPASLSEKYVASWLFVVVGGALAFIGGFLVYDVIQYITALVLLPGHAQWATPAMFDFFTYARFPAFSDSVAFWDMMSGWIMFLWIQSVYALGGTFFRKLQWLIVTLLSFAALIGLAMLLKHQMMERDFSMFFDAKQHLQIFSAVFFVLTWVNYWLSYRFFKRSQVICNKWINI